MDADAPVFDVSPEMMQPNVKMLCPWSVLVLAISMAPELSSNTLQWTLVFWSFISNPRDFNSFKRFIIGMASRSAYERPVYSASVVLIAISLCN